jgi:hypothetical protein
MDDYDSMYDDHGNNNARDVVAEQEFDNYQRRANVQL